MPACLPAAAILATSLILPKRECCPTSSPVPTPRLALVRSIASAGVTVSQSHARTEKAPTRAKEHLGRKHILLAVVPQLSQCLPHYLFCLPIGINLCIVKAVGSRGVRELQARRAEAAVKWEHRQGGAREPGSLCADAHRPGLLTSDLRQRAAGARQLPAQLRKHSTAPSTHKLMPPSQHLLISSLASGTPNW